MVRVKRSFLPDACVRNWRTARAHDRQNRYGCGARKCARRRATPISMRRYERKEISATPKIVIAHDPRFFSKEFAELAAKVAAESGCDACVFEDPRSVPELSFAVRYLKASSGVVITASHNPPYDNGYKVYFSDGAQVIEPHASEIIAKVNAIRTESFTPVPKDRQGKVTRLGAEIDEAYMERLETLILDPQEIREAKSLRIIYTPLHGTGKIGRASCRER